MPTPPSPKPSSSQATTPRLLVDGLSVEVAGSEGTSVPNTVVLHDVRLSIAPGEVHVIMGPNGSGKSTLANTLLGNPEYRVTTGRIVLDGEDITTLPTPARAQRGLFLGFQYPQELDGVTILNFLRQAISARKGIDISVLEVRLALIDWMKRLEIDPSFMKRYVNEGFSGGEKKRNEILQMALLEPQVAILDETDSGLDIDALRIVSSGINEVRSTRPDMSVLMITHYQRLLDYVQPDVVHVLIDGHIVESGGIELAQRLEASGYDSLRELGRSQSGPGPRGNDQSAREAVEVTR